MLESLFIKVASLKAFDIIQYKLQHRRFPVKFAKVLQNYFLTEHIRRLLLEILHKLSPYCI